VEAVHVHEKRFDVDWLFGEPASVFYFSNHVLNSAEQGHITESREKIPPLLHSLYNFPARAHTSLTSLSSIIHETVGCRLKQITAAAGTTN
jgi:hypothetical protein